MEVIEPVIEIAKAARSVALANFATVIVELAKLMVFLALLTFLFFCLSKIFVFFVFNI